MPYRRRALPVAAAEAASGLPPPARREPSALAFLLLQLSRHSFFHFSYTVLSTNITDKPLFETFSDSKHRAGPHVNQI